MGEGSAQEREQNSAPSGAIGPSFFHEVRIPEPAPAGGGAWPRPPSGLPPVGIETHSCNPKTTCYYAANAQITICVRCYEKPENTPIFENSSNQRLHFDRTAGRHCHHRHPGGPVVARPRQSQDQGSGNHVPE